MPRAPIRPALALLCAFLCLAACSPAAAAKVSPTATAQPTATLAPTPTQTPAPVWQVYTDPKYGFKVAIPAVLWIDPAYQTPAQSDSSTVRFDANPTAPWSPSPIAHLFRQSGGIAVYASTSPTQCDLQGLPVQVGGGITGYRSDNLTNPPMGAHAPGGSVDFVTGGLYVSIFIGAEGPTSSSVYWTDFAAAWQHILASFTPGPAIPGGHPCG